MSHQKKNFDLDVPISFDYVSDPVLQGNFTQPIRPIFWGPNQIATNFQSYVVPDQSAWRNFEHINIPQVVRFHHASTGAYDTEDFKDQGTPPSPPTFGCGNFSYIMQNTFTVGFTLDPGWSAVISGGLPNGSGGFDVAYVTNVNTLASFGNLRTVMEATIITVKHGTTVMFSGDVWTWMMTHGPGQQGQGQFRCVYWFAKCGFFPLPPAEQAAGSLPTITRCTGAFDTAQFYDGPPRCWFEQPAGSGLWQSEQPVSETPFMGDPNLDPIWSAWYGNPPSVTGVNPCPPMPSTPTSPPSTAGVPMVPLPPERNP